MKEDFDPLIEENLRKQDQFATFISVIDKLTLNKEKHISLYMGNNFINVYNNFFDKHYAYCLKELLPLSIDVTPGNTSTFPQWYLGVTDPDDI